MSEQPLRSITALNECKGWVKAMITEVSLPDPLLDQFVNEFAGDFAAMLDGERGEAIWRANAKFFHNRARQLGTRAEYYAIDEGAAEINKRHLRRALGDVKPECDAPRVNAVAHFYCGCLHVPTHPQDGDDPDPRFRAEHGC